MIARFKHPGLLDGGLALALVIAAEYHVWSGAAAGSKAVTAPAALVIAGAVAFRRRAPLMAVLAAMVATVLQSALASSPQAPWLIATWVILFYSAGRYLERNRAIVALAAGLSGAAVDEALARDRSVAGFAFALVALVVVPWAAGRAVRGHETRADTVERESAETTRRALAAERARIARDLHDVVAHAVSLIVLQAEAGEAVLDGDPARAREQLVSIERTGRQALAELARLLEMTGSDENEGLTAQPRIAQLPALVQEVRAAGLDVELRVEGETRVLEAGIDLTVYRVVQEALTNALKHGAPDGRTAIELRYTHDAIAVEVVSDGAASRNGGGSGRGLVGMRERVSLYGGSFRAGPLDGDCFAVTVSVPT